MSTNFFSSLSGKFDYMSSMSGLIGDYASIKNGSYGSLMKSYVKKVGNKTALNAYRETGSTTTAVDNAANTSSSSATSSSKKSSSSSKTNFLDSHLSNVKGSGSVYQSELLQKLKKQDETATYDKDGTKTQNADTTLGMDTTI
ncbi:hypothetical protein [Butyrivibrio sp. XBB1001]|uniref:hypothetical protein n=1 Tax=Butyrivibrio sp. XBB1001 TaxID=1280682 RepID=UPI000403783D|nr:hypothetical protein [Butyrivibrio sp. XBB1001]